jgi:pyruvate/2-oxoglutarate dehydrogenase complex dihydrolipoamide acyltransferase (E2) component
MKLFEKGPRAKRLRRNATTALGLLVLASLLALTLARASGAAATAVPLGQAGSFGVLAGAGITNTGPTTVGGDIGTFPTTSITGTGTMTVSGTNHGGDAVTQQAKNDWTTAFNNAAGQGPTNPITTDLGGQTLTAGVYNSASTIGLTGALTLDGGGNFGSVFVFQAGSALTTASASSVNLINGAQACNVFWQVGSSATLGTGSSFKGTLLASSSITATTGARIVGRLLASTGTVTLDTNVIGVPSCVGPQSPPNADRQIYCDAAGNPYDLVIGQDKLPPYDTLGLIASTIDPVTGAKTCARVTAATPPTTTATTPTATTPTPSGPTARQIAAAKARRLAAVKAAAVAKAKRIALAKSQAIVKKTPKPKPKPAVQSFGFTG